MRPPRPRRDPTTRRTDDGSADAGIGSGGGRRPSGRRCAVPDGERGRRGPGRPEHGRGGTASSPIASTGTERPAARLEELRRQAAATPRARSPTLLRPALPLHARLHPLANAGPALRGATRGFPPRSRARRRHGRSWTRSATTCTGSSARWATPATWSPAAGPGRRATASSRRRWYRCSRSSSPKRGRARRNGWWRSRPPAPTGCASRPYRACRTTRAATTCAGRSS